MSALSKPIGHGKRCDGYSVWVLAPVWVLVISRMAMVQRLARGIAAPPGNR